MFTLHLEQLVFTAHFEQPVFTVCFKQLVFRVHVEQLVFTLHFEQLVFTVHFEQLVFTVQFCTTGVEVFSHAAPYKHKEQIKGRCSSYRSYSKMRHIAVNDPFIPVFHSAMTRLHQSAGRNTSSIVVTCPSRLTDSEPGSKVITRDRASL